MSRKALIKQFIAEGLNIIEQTDKKSKKLVLKINKDKNNSDNRSVFIQLGDVRFPETGSISIPENEITTEKIQEIVDSFSNEYTNIIDELNETPGLVIPNRIDTVQVDIKEGNKRIAKDVLFNEVAAKANELLAAERRPAPVYTATDDRRPDYMRNNFYNLTVEEIEELLRDNEGMPFVYGINKDGRNYVTINELISQLEDLRDVKTLTRTPSNHVVTTNSNSVTPVVPVQTQDNTVAPVQTQDNTVVPVQTQDDTVDVTVDNTSSNNETNDLIEEYRNYLKQVIPANVYTDDLVYNDFYVHGIEYNLDDNEKEKIEEYRDRIKAQNEISPIIPRPAGVVDEPQSDVNYEDHENYETTGTLENIIIPEAPEDEQTQEIVEPVIIDNPEDTQEANDVQNITITDEPTSTEPNKNVQANSDDSIDIIGAFENQENEDTLKEDYSTLTNDELISRINEIEARITKNGVETEEETNELKALQEEINKRNGSALEPLPGEVSEPEENREFNDNILSDEDESQSIIDSLDNIGLIGKEDEVDRKETQENPTLTPPTDTPTSTPDTTDKPHEDTPSDTPTPPEDIPTEDYPTPTPEPVEEFGLEEVEPLVTPQYNNDNNTNDYIYYNSMNNIATEDKENHLSKVSKSNKVVLGMGLVLGVATASTIPPLGVALIAASSLGIVGESRPTISSIRGWARKRSMESLIKNLNNKLAANYESGISKEYVGRLTIEYPPKTDLERLFRIKSSKNPKLNAYDDDIKVTVMRRNSSGVNEELIVTSKPKEECLEGEISTQEIFELTQVDIDEVINKKYNKGKNRENFEVDIESNKPFVSIDKLKYAYSDLGGFDYVRSNGLFNKVVEVVKKKSDKRKTSFTFFKKLSQAKLFSLEKPVPNNQEALDAQDLMIMGEQPVDEEAQDYDYDFQEVDENDEALETPVEDTLSDVTITDTEDFDFEPEHNQQTNQIIETADVTPVVEPVVEPSTIDENSNANVTGVNEINLDEIVEPIGYEEGTPEANTFLAEQNPANNVQLAPEPPRQDSKPVVKTEVEEPVAVENEPTIDVSQDLEQLPDLSFINDDILTEENEAESIDDLMSQFEAQDAKKRVLQ